MQAKCEVCGVPWTQHDDTCSRHAFPIRAYLAGRYSRRQELCGYRDLLVELGWTVRARWLDGKHELLDREGLSAEAEAKDRIRFAREDWDDLRSCNLCLSFTEQPRSTNTRGGRHVEFGAALALGMRVLVIGPRENVFHCLPEVERFPTWTDFLGRWFPITSVRPAV